MHPPGCAQASLPAHRPTAATIGSIKGVPAGREGISTGPGPSVLQKRPQIGIAPQQPTHPARHTLILATPNATPLRPIGFWRRLRDAKSHIYLWMVEVFFRSLKSITENRPIFHKCDETIRGHVFCSSLALVLVQELQLKLVERGWSVEWPRLKDDLDALEDVTVKCAGQPFIVRSETRGGAGKALQAAGVALGPTVRPAQNNRTQV